MSDEATLDDFAQENKDSGAESNSIQTEISLSRLEEYISIIKGTKPDRVSDEQSDGSEPYLVVSTLTDEERKYTPDTDGPKATPQDTLMIMDGSKSGRVYRGESGVIGSTMAAIRPENTNPQYLRYFLESNFERLNSATKGSAVPHTDKDILRSLEYPVYPLPEQRKIATVLYTVDRAIEKTEEIIEQEERILNGTLNELFTRGLDSSGSLRPSPDDSPESYEKAGRFFVPTEWNVDSLQKLCTENITYGIVQPGPHVEDGVPYINTEDMTDGNIPTEGLSKTSQEIAEKYSRSEIQEGELVVTIRATIGAVDQVPSELDGANLTRGTARVVPGDSIDNRFLLWAIRSNVIQSELEARVKGTTFDEINLDQLGKIPVPYPVDKNEQAAIVDILSTIDSKLESEQSYLESLHRLKRGLIQDLFSGTVRTTDTNIEVPDEIAQYG